MLIVLAFVFGAVIGLAIHFGLPDRDTRGSAFAPILAAGLGGLAWLVMTWLGQADTGWIWLVSIAVPIVITWPVMALITRTRVAHDQRERARLKLA
jgi:hypothetical protein